MRFFGPETSLFDCKFQQTRTRTTSWSRNILVMCVAQVALRFASCDLSRSGICIRKCTFPTSEVVAPWDRYLDTSWRKSFNVIVSSKRGRLSPGALEDNCFEPTCYDLPLPANTFRLVLRLPQQNPASCLTRCAIRLRIAQGQLTFFGDC